MPLSLRGWLPVWDVEKRRGSIDDVVAWTSATLRSYGVKATALSEVSMSGDAARAYAQRLTRDSSDVALRRPLHALLRRVLPEIHWHSVYVQTYAHFRILMPGDHDTPVPPHTDWAFGHALDERNIWLALTEAVGPGALRVLGLRKSLLHIAKHGYRRGVDEGTTAIPPRSARAGEVLLFTPLHLHAAHAPVDHPRLSIDLRIIPRPKHALDQTFSPLAS